jgi:hypothetical protein
MCKSFVYNPMKTLKSGYLALVLAAATVSSQAHLINPVDFSTDGPIGSWSDELEYLEGILGESLIYLAKYEAGNGFETEAAPLGAGQFDVQLFGASGFVKWDLTGTGYELAYVLVKSGQSAYRLYGVDDEQVLKSGGALGPVFEAFDGNGNQDVSHLTFFGSSTVPRLPDSGVTVLLLGAGLLGLGMLRRADRS